MGADILAFLGLIWRNPLVKYALAVLALLGGIKLYGASERRRGAADVRAASARRSIETAKEIGNAVERSRATGATWYDRLRNHAARR